MKRAKRPLSLLEVMIAMALAAILLGALFAVYRQIAASKQKIGALEEKILPSAKVQLRLSQLFSEVSNWSFERGELNFTFDNGIDPLHDFCHECPGFLYVDENHRLILFIWSKNREVRSEILMENVTSFSFQFFDVKKKVWKKRWTDEEKGLPAMVELVLNGTHYAFFPQGAS